jgi:hypothetical protein
MERSLFLKNVWEKLTLNELFSKGDASPTNMRIFESTLNMSIPLTPEDKQIHTYINHLFKCDKRAFANWVRLINMPYLFLYTDPVSIAYKLNIYKLVYISYHQDGEYFKVTKFNQRRGEPQCDEDEDEDGDEDVKLIPMPVPKRILKRGDVHAKTYAAAARKSDLESLCEDIANLESAETKSESDHTKDN